VASRPPHRLVARLAHARDAAHHRIEIPHLEGDVVERRQSRACVGDAVVLAVAAQEAHVRGAVGDLEAQLLDREALGGFLVHGVDDRMRELDGLVRILEGRGPAVFHDEAIVLRLGTAHFEAFAAARDVEGAIGFPDFLFRPRKGDGQHRRGGCPGDRQDVRMVAGAAEEVTAAARARRHQTPQSHELRGLRDIGKLELDAAQSHASCFAIASSCRSSAALLPATPYT
jgi:hypothetical protein